MVRLLRAARRRPALAVPLSYLLVGITALAPSIRPGRTLVAADMATLSSPYSTVAGTPGIHNLLLSDVTFQFYPWFRFLSEAMSQGHLPQWNPTILGGVVVTPNGFVSPYYPPTWLAAVLSPFDAYNLLVLLHLVAGALGTYVLSRAVGAGRLSAWVAGLGAFAAAFWVHWSMHLVHLSAFVLLPWALAAAHRLVEHPSRRRVAALAVVYGLWWLGGNPQYVYNGTVLVVVYALGLLLLRRRGSWRAVARPALAVGGALALGLALAAPMLLPTVREAGRILRAGEVSPTYHVNRSEVIRVLVPDATGSPPDEIFYGSNDELRMDSPFVGVTALLLAVAALGGRRDPVRLLLVAAVVAVGVLAYSLPIHRPLHAVVPGYDRFRAVPPRWFSVLPALVLPLAALGLDDLLGGRKRSRIALVAGATVSLAAMAAWFAWQLTKDDAPHRFFAGRVALATAVVVVAVAAGWFACRRPVVALSLLVVCVLVEIGVHTTRWFPSVPERTAYPPTEALRIAEERGGRIVRVGGRDTVPPLAADIPMVFGTSDVDGQAVMFPTDYDRYRRLIDDYGDYALRYTKTPPLSDGAVLTSTLLDAMDVRTILADAGVAVPPGYVPLTGSPPLVYARPSPGPALVVTRADPAGVEEMWRRVADPTWDPVNTAAVVGLGRPVDGGPGTVTPRGPLGDREHWDVDAPSGGFLRVSGRFDDGWSARINGRPARVYRADGIFRGVVLPPGRHRVDFSYANPAEHAGRILGLMALAAAALLLPLRRRRTHETPRPAGPSDP